MNIDKQALREEFRYMQEHYSDPADRARQVIYIAAEALLDELEATAHSAAVDHEAACSLVEENEELKRKLETAEKQIVELSRAANVNNQWKPEVCPVTGRQFFMWIEHPALGYVPTYGGPFDSYTIPTRGSDGEFSRERIRREHAEWSDKTFGNVGPIGPLKHLSKEALEAAADPSDPLEWADMQFLLWDAQRRAGISDEQITLAMVEKLAVNKKREWPEPKDGEPRLHIKEQPAPVVPDEMATSNDMNLYQKSFTQGWNACRAAMINGGKS